MMMMRILPATDREKFQALVAALAVLIAVLVAFLWASHGGTTTSFVKLPLAYKLTQKRAVLLTTLQMNGSVPLMMSDVVDDSSSSSQHYEPPRLVDVIESMRHDAHREQLDGLCAMNYNLPLSVCYLPRFGGERDVLMFNLRMIGFSADALMGDEYSLLCDRGKTPYGAERFQFVWIEFYDRDAGRNFLRVEGHLGRVIQHLAWLNLGTTVCDGMSMQRQADILYELTRFHRRADEQ